MGNGGLVTLEVSIPVRHGHLVVGRGWIVLLSYQCSCSIIYPEEPTNEPGLTIS